MKLGVQVGHMEMEVEIVFGVTPNLDIVMIVLALETNTALFKNKSVHENSN